jgi:hypothetical protein
MFVYYYQQKSLNYHTAVVLDGISVEFSVVLLVELSTGGTLVELVLLPGFGTGFLRIISFNNGHSVESCFTSEKSYLPSFNTLKNPGAL